MSLTRISNHFTPRQQQLLCHTGGRTRLDVPRLENDAHIRKIHKQNKADFVAAQSQQQRSSVSPAPAAAAAENGALVVASTSPAAAAPSSVTTVSAPQQQFISCGRAVDASAAGGRIKAKRGIMRIERPPSAEMSPPLGKRQIVSTASQSSLARANDGDLSVEHQYTRRKAHGEHAPHFKPSLGNSTMGTTHHNDGNDHFKRHQELSSAQQEWNSAVHATKRVAREQKIADIVTGKNVQPFIVPESHTFAQKRHGVQYRRDAPLVID